jgi:hypothetical protein
MIQRDEMSFSSYTFKLLKEDPVGVERLSFKHENGIQVYNKTASLVQSLIIIRILDQMLLKLLRNCLNLEIKFY